MAVLGKLAGPKAIHIVLGEKMLIDLKATNPEAVEVIVLNNAGLVDVAVHVTSPKVGPIVLGHISNLTEDKGIGRVINAVRTLLKFGYDVKVKIAGSINDAYSENAIREARTELGQVFEYIGPVYGEKKTDFFSVIDVLLFPSLYGNEAAPLVIMEALSSGVTCMAYNVGCIAEQIGQNGGVVVDENEDFSMSCVDFLSNFDRELQIRGALEQYKSLRAEYDVQLEYIRKVVAD